MKIDFAESTGHEVSIATSVKANRKILQDGCGTSSPTSSAALGSVVAKESNFSSKGSKERFAPYASKESGLNISFESVTSLASGFILVNASVSLQSFRGACCNLLTYLHLIFALGTFIVNFTLPWLRHGMAPEAWHTCQRLDEELCDHGEFCKTKVLQIIVGFVNTLVFVSFLCFVNLRTNRTSHFLSRVRLYFTIQWLNVQIEAFAIVFEFCSDEKNNRGRVGILAFSVWIILTTLGALLLQYSLIVRIQAMEREMREAHYGSTLKKLFYAEIFIAAYAAICVLLYGLSVPLPDSVFRACLLISCSFGPGCLIVFLVIACIAFKVPVQVLKTGEKYNLDKRERDILRYALRVSIRTLFWVRACAISTVAMFLSLGVSALTYKHLSWMPLVMKLVVLVDGVTNSMCVLLTSGLVQKFVPNSRERGVDSVDPKMWRGSENVDWDSQVEELAARSLTLEALLNFWMRLGKDVMQSFNPAIHRTADVVRMAVIPMSAESAFGPCALSVVLMDNNRCMADRMVSHAWDNLFAHLVAAVVADAMDVGAYDSVLPRLAPSRIKGLITELNRKDLLRMRYWICAFCVNQHRSICSEICPRDRDPLSGQFHPICSCGERKIHNDTPPLREDGESIECEMNKFDDMIVYLGAHKSGFRHVIVVDEDFVLFQRAWCIAEIYRANRCGFDQAFRFHSSESVKKYSGKLMKLSVQHMDAYRREDKNAILQRIPDVHAFNKDLRHMICDQHAGLLRQWMDACGDFAFVGQAARIITRYSSRSTISSEKSENWTVETRAVRTEPMNSCTAMKSCAFERWRISL